MFYVYNFGQVVYVVVVLALLVYGSFGYIPRYQFTLLRRAEVFMYTDSRLKVGIV